MLKNQYKYINDVQSNIDFLRRQFEMIKEYPDQSLFFQNPLIFEGWVSLIRALEKIEPFYEQKREQTTETNVLYLLSLRNLRINYKRLQDKYYSQLKELIEFYSGWLVGECISGEGMEVLETDQYLQDMDNVEDFYQYLESLNDNSNNARSVIYTVLTDVLNVLLVIMNRGGRIIRERFPYLNDFVKAINDDLRLYTKDYGEDILREMNEDLNRHYKEHRTDPNTPALWGEMLTAYEQALKMAAKKEFVKCDEPRQEHWDSHQPKDFMDDNSEMINLIYELCYTDKLIDFSDSENIQRFLNVLSAENIELFYYLIVMRNLIQCEMFPELKVQHEEWLSKGIKQPGDEGDEEQTYQTEPPKINLQMMLKQDWFAEFRTKEEYNEEWTDAFINALMVSKWKDVIAKEWASGSTHKNRRNQIKGYIVGLLKDTGVLNGQSKSIAQKIGIMDNPKTFADYMRDGQNQPYADWVKEYVNG